MSSSAPARATRFRRGLGSSWQKWTSRHRLAVVVVLAALAISAWYARGLSLLPTLVLWGCWLTAGLVYLRHCGARFFGPVCFHDLARTGRQTRYKWQKN